MNELENKDTMDEIQEGIKLGDYKITIIEDDKLGEPVINIPIEEKHCWVMELANNNEFDYNPEVGDSNFYDSIAKVNYLLVTKTNKAMDVIYTMNLFASNKFLAFTEEVDIEKETIIKDKITVYAYPRVVEKDGISELKGVKFYSKHGKVLNKNIKGIYLNKSDIGSGIYPEDKIVETALTEELKDKYSEAKVEEIIKANVLGLNTKYIEELPEDYKYMNLVTLFLKNGYKVDKILSDDLTQEQIDFMINMVEGSDRALSKMDFTRPKHLWSIDLQAYKFKVNPNTAYTIEDTEEVAKDKLIKFIQNREATRFINTYTVDNLAIEDMDEQMIKLVNLPAIEGVSKYDMLSALDFLGIWRIIEDDTAKYFKLFRGNVLARFENVNSLYRIDVNDDGEITCNGDLLNPKLVIVDYFIEILPFDNKKRKSDILDSLEFKREYTSVVNIKDECKLFYSSIDTKVDDSSKTDYIFGGSIVEGTELVGKDLNHLRDANLTVGINTLTEILPKRYLTNLRDRFTESTLIDIDFTGSTSDEIELFSTIINAMTLEVKFYSKDFGFRKSLAIPRLVKIGDRLALKFTYGDLKIGLSQCVRVRLDISKPVSFDRQTEQRLAMTRILNDKK